MSPFQVLIVGADPRLTAELKSAFAPLSRIKIVTRSASDLRHAVDGVRSWRPQVALIEMTGDASALRALCAEMRAASPETALVGLFRPSIVPPETAESAVLIEAIRAGLVDFVRRPVSSRDVQDLFERLSRPGHGGKTRFGTVVSFVSNKGGVGKSTLAVNVATGLARRHPGEVLLMDVSLQMGVCAPMLDLRPTTTLMDAVREKDRLDERLIRELVTRHGSGLDLLAAPLNAVEANDVDDAIVSHVLTLARRSYRFVVVDTFPLLDRVVMAVLDLSDRTYIVLENVVPTILSAVKFLELLDELKFPPARERVVVNRYLRSAGNPDLSDVSVRLARTIDFMVPFDKAVVAAANTGVPFGLTAWRWSRRARALDRIVGDVEQAESERAEREKNQAGYPKPADAESDDGERDAVVA